MKGETGYLQTMLDPWNDLVGGLPVGSMLGLFGPASAGKTILAMQMGYEVVRSTGQNVLIIDTEGSAPTYKEWHSSLNKRYGVDTQLVFLDLSTDAKKGNLTVAPMLPVDSKKPKIFVADIRNIEKLLAFHGRGIKLTMSEKGKMAIKPVETLWIDDIWETPIGSWVARNNVKCLIYDSVTNPLTVFGTERENFPARSTATNFLMLQAQILCQELGLVAIDVMHETVDPQNSYSRPNHSGGNAISYNHKYEVYIERGKTQKTPPIPGREEAMKENEEMKKTVRCLFLARHPSRQPWVRGVLLNLTSTGYVDPMRDVQDKKVKS